MAISIMDKVVLPLRGVQGLLAVVVLGLMAYVVSWWSSHWKQFSPHEVNFLIFSPVWSLLALAALVVIPWKLPEFAEQKFPKAGLLGLEVLTTLYWFGGFIALAVFLTDRICFGSVCAVAKAGVAISAFSWAVWAATATMGVIRMFYPAVKVGKTSESKVSMHQGV